MQEELQKIINASTLQISYSVLEKNIDEIAEKRCKEKIAQVLDNIPNRIDTVRQIIPVIEVLKKYSKS